MYYKVVGLSQNLMCATLDLYCFLTEQNYRKNAHKMLETYFGFNH